MVCSYKWWRNFHIPRDGLLSILMWGLSYGQKAFGLLFT